MANNTKTKTIPAGRFPPVRMTLDCRSIAMPVWNEARHAVGWEVVRIGPELNNSLRRLATEGRL